MLLYHEITAMGCNIFPSQYSKSSPSETRIRINYPCGPFKQTLQENSVLKHECIRTTTAGQEAFRATALRPKFGTF